MNANIEEAKLILENAKRSQELYFNAIVELIRRLEQEKK